MDYGQKGGEKERKTQKMNNFLFCKSAYLGTNSWRVIWTLNM